MKESTPVERENAMMSAADELFDGSHDVVKLQDGREVPIKPAKVKHLRQITEFVQEFVNTFNSEELVRLLSGVSQMQQEKIAEGSSAYSLNTGELVQKVAGDASLILRIFNSGVDAFSKLVPLFSDLSLEEFEDLELDDAALLVFGIFGRNYHFFTQRVLPVIQGSIAQKAMMGSRRITNAPEK